MVYIPQLDEAYAAMAESIVSCGDSDIKQLELLNETLSADSRDEHSDLMFWLYDADAGVDRLAAMIDERRSQGG